MAGPLRGYCVVDVTTRITGPFATLMLGDPEADVIELGSGLREKGVVA
jgi:crotonobetainyl-CoA:carnitine CoA-transferase CaiB-like acyl-CoA transferase